MPQQPHGRAPSLPARETRDIVDHLHQVIVRYPQGLADVRDTEPLVCLLPRQEHQGAQPQSSRCTW